MSLTALPELDLIPGGSQKVADSASRSGTYERPSDAENCSTWPEYIRCPTSLSRASWMGMKTFGAMRPTKAMESRLAAQAR